MKRQLTTQQKRLVKLARQCGLSGFCDIESQSRQLGLARALAEIPQENAPEVEAALKRCIELTNALRSEN